ncbi:MAG: glycyl-radical enzyme activating protein [Desulfobacterales bacterium]|nr:glycyl-radical enzyme activating protein [Desulfobacterales bacterium]
MADSPNKEDIKGTVLHLEKMALFDGKGMRTVVFLKGCPLRCQWCSTPESQKLAPQLGYDADKCTGCQDCVTICPKEAIRPTDDGQKVKTDPDRCDHCFECVTVCPENARKRYGREMSCRQLMEEIEKDDVFYFHSGGGVTISGGEPLIQVDYVKAVLSGCRERGIHTAIETSGHVPWENFEAVLPLIDAILIDIKVHDSGRHRELTGHGNARIMSNIERIDRSGFPIDLYIRIPLVPGINDSEANLLATARYCKGLKKFKELHILPYHRMGVASYRFLDMKYPLEKIESPNIEMIEAKVARLKQEGIEVKIGG